MCCDHNGIADDIGGALPVESTSQTVGTNGHDTKTGVPPWKARGRREACEQTPDSPRRWKMGRAMQGGTAEPTSREQNTRQRRGQGKGENRESHRKRRKILVGKRRRRGRAARRLLRQRKNRNRARARGQEITVATHNVRTMAVDGTHGVGWTLDILSVYDQLGCDVIGLQEIRCS